MKPLELFLRDIDAAWKPLRPDRQPLYLIGSGALLLQTDYHRATKDSDILEAVDLDDATKRGLVALAGKNTALHTRHRTYVEIVRQGLPFLPQRPLWHASADFDAGLQHFSILMLDVVDVTVSKLARFHSDDRADIQAMIARGQVSHAALIGRFEAAKDVRQDTAYADDLPKYVDNLHRVERDYLGVEETEIELPGWV